VHKDNICQTQNASNNIQHHARRKILCVTKLQHAANTVYRLYEKKY